MRSKQQAAEVWLKNYLSKGKRPTADIVRDGEMNNPPLKETLLKQAKKALGFEALKVGPAWYWLDPSVHELPQPTAGAKEETPAAEPSTDDYWTDERHRQWEEQTRLYNEEQERVRARRALVEQPWLCSVPFELLKFASEEEVNEMLPRVKHGHLENLKSRAKPQPVKVPGFVEIVKDRIEEIEQPRVGSDGRPMFYRTLDEHGKQVRLPKMEKVKVSVPYKEQVECLVESGEFTPGEDLAEEIAKWTRWVELAKERQKMFRQQSTVASQ